MKRIYKIIIIFIVIAVFTGMIGIGVFAFRQQQLSKDEKIINMGKVDGAYIRGEYNDGEYLIRSEHISVSKAEVDAIMNKYEMNQVNKNKNDIIKHLLLRETLYYAAESAGFTATDEEVQEYIYKGREMFKRASNRDDFLLYLKAAELTEDEYWEIEYEKLQKEISISKYLSSEEEKITKEYMSKYTDNYIDEFKNLDIQRLLSTKIDEIFNDIIQEENIDISRFGIK